MVMGSIFGWVWHDVCESGKDGEPQLTSAPEGCIDSTAPLGSYRADSDKDPFEPAIVEILVRLGEGTCPAIGLAEVMTIAFDISYSFTNLKAGTYCVSINPSEEPNFSLLRPGIWTNPNVSEGTLVQQLPSKRDKTSMILTLVGTISSFREVSKGQPILPILGN